MTDATDDESGEEERVPARIGRSAATGFRWRYSATEGEVPAHSVMASTDAAERLASIQVPAPFVRPQSEGDTKTSGRLPWSPGNVRHPPVSDEVIMRVAGVATLYNEPLTRTLKASPHLRNIHLCVSLSEWRGWLAEYACTAIGKDSLARDLPFARSNQTASNLSDQAAQLVYALVRKRYATRQATGLTRPQLRVVTTEKQQGDLEPSVDFNG